MQSEEYREAARNLRGVTKTKPLIKLPPKRTDYLPQGFRALSANEFGFDTNGKTLIVTGTPPDEDADPDCSLHNCDDMGCHWEHVLMVINLEDYTWFGWNPFREGATPV